MVLAAAAGYEAAIAFGRLQVGPVPGQGPPGEDVVVDAALLAMLAGAALCALYASLPGRRIGPPELLLAPAGVAFVVARFYSYDPYYAPTLRRMSEDGAVAGSWIVALVGLALVAAILGRLRPRLGMSAAAVTLLLSAVTALWEGTGH